MISCWTVNPDDVGLTPTLSANFGIEAQLAEQPVVSRKVAGANPVCPAIIVL